MTPAQSRRNKSLQPSPDSAIRPGWSPAAQSTRKTPPRKHRPKSATCGRG